MSNHTFTDAEIDAWEAAFDAAQVDDTPAYDESALFSEFELSVGCECEIDWNCGLCGGTTRPTFIERRYQGLDAEEARAHGACWDL